MKVTDILSSIVLASILLVFSSCRTTQKATMQTKSERVIAINHDTIFLRDSVWRVDSITIVEDTAGNIIERNRVKYLYRNRYIYKVLDGQELREDTLVKTQSTHDEPSGARKNYQGAIIVALILLLVLICRQYVKK